MLLVSRQLTTSNKKLLVAPSITTSSKKLLRPIGGPSPWPWSWSWSSQTWGVSAGEPCVLAEPKRIITLH